MLEVENLRVSYGRIQALKGVSLKVECGTVVALIGANGAGKTTLLRAISGVQPVNGGAIRFEGRPIDALGSHRRVALGIAQSPEGRQVFKPLTVEENLQLGTYRRRSGSMRDGLARVYAMFPILHEKRRLPAGNLSGGQQQMLAIGRALLSDPTLLLLDEPSLGLAPLIIEQIFGVLDGLRAEGVTVLLVEQNAALALAHADRAYVLETGLVAHAGEARALLRDQRVRDAYLGV